MLRRLEKALKEMNNEILNGLAQKSSISPSRRQMKPLEKSPRDIRKFRNADVLHAKNFATHREPVGSDVPYLRVYPRALWSRNGQDGLFNSLNASGMHIAELSHGSV